MKPWSDCHFAYKTASSARADFHGYQRAIDKIVYGQTNDARC